MLESPRDLFGEVPVTTPEIDAWLRAIPRIEPGSPRAAYYVKHWDVPAKIRAAKLRGEWHQVERLADQREPAPFWWHRFTWN